MKKILIVDDVISTGESVAALEELVKKANEQGGYDNITAVIIL